VILNVDSSIPTFKRVEFHDGLNVLLSDSQPGATEKQTRNSAGKTSLVEIINFLLGADCHKGNLFRTDALIEHTFRADFLFGGKLLTVERGGADPSKIFIVNIPEDREAYPLKMDKQSERIYIPNVKWRALLGSLLFGLAEPTSSGWNGTNRLRWCHYRLA